MAILVVEEDVVLPADAGWIAFSVISIVVMMFLTTLSNIIIAKCLELDLATNMT
jgi:hypothetical protein